MSYQGRMLIKEPELRWPVILVAAIITTCIVLVTAGALHLTLTRPAASPASQPRLEGALRPEMRRRGEQVAALTVAPLGRLGIEAEVTSLDTEGMLREGREYARIAPNVIIKCPLTRDGLKATRQLTSEGIRVNITLCFSAAQAILAAKAGAAYVSPFVGRLDDVGQSGLAVLTEIVEIYRNYEWRTQVLASSIRHPIHVIEAARAGADVATMPFKVLGQLFDHPLTNKGLEQFLNDWRKAGRE